MSRKAIDIRVIPSIMKILSHPVLLQKFEFLYHVSRIDKK